MGPCERIPTKTGIYQGLNAIEAKKARIVLVVGVEKMTELAGAAIGEVLTKASYLKEEDENGSFADIFARGWTSLKLYFMLGLPEETMEDTEEIVRLVDKIRALGRSVAGRTPQLRINLSTFVPKAHTPFQWVAQPSEEELRMLSNDRGEVPTKIYRAKGCTSCDNTGYKGRMALLEILKMNSDLDDLLAHGATTKEIKDAAYKQGFFTLADDGVRHIIEGITSIKEVARVADLTERMG